MEPAPVQPCAYERFPGAAASALLGTTSNQQWFRRLGGALGDMAWTAALNSQGECVVGGTHNGMSIDTKPYPAAGQDGFAVRLSVNNEVLGVLTVSSPLGDAITTATYSGTQIAVAGTHAAQVLGGALPLPAPKGNTDVFVAQLDPGLSTLAWQQGVGGVGTDVVRAVAPDGAGGLVVAGQLAGEVGFGGTDYPAVGTGDAYVAGAGGVPGWLERFGPAGDSAEVYGVAVVGTAVYVVGRFKGAVASPKLVSAGGWDGFLVRYDKP